jgi:hypothetical protein
MPPCPSRLRRRVPPAALQPEPRGDRLQGGHIALPPLLAGQQPDHLSRRQADRPGNVWRRGEALLVEMGVDGEAQPDADQPRGPAPRLVRTLFKIWHASCPTRSRGGGGPTASAGLRKV